MPKWINQVKSWLKVHFKFHAATLKHTPFIAAGSEQAAADHWNSLVGAGVDAAVEAAVATGVPIAANALHIKGDTLKGAPGIVGEQHDLAATVFNSLITSKLSELEGQAP